MWIRLDTYGRYLPIKLMLNHHEVEFMSVASSVIAYWDTPRNRKITTLIVLQHPCSVRESVPLSDLLGEYQTYNHKRVGKMR